MSIVKGIRRNLSDAHKIKKSDAFNKNQCQFGAEDLILYRDKDCKYEDLKSGYQEMAQINLEFSELSCAYDLDECLEYESWLSESDMSNDTSYSKKRRYILCRP
ncbi:CopG family transcriptional regulator [Clostridium sp.]|uniref:CopG family transcriptional regulator n=1 Tax=Clostridium sp. TaxID=1506 RepID=UPI0034639D56